MDRQNVENPNVVAVFFCVGIVTQIFWCASVVPLSSKQTGERELE